MPLAPRFVNREHLADVVGRSFLAFVCNADEPTIHEHIAGNGGLDEAQADSLERALEIARTSAVLAVQADSERLGLFPLLEYQPDADTTLAIHLRRSAGGSVPDADEDDPLRVLARDLFPALLLASDPLGFPAGLTEETHWFNIAVFRHPALERFGEMVRADDELMALFPADDPNIGPHGALLLSVGQMLRFQLALLAPELMAGAYVALRLQDAVEHEAFVAESARRLEILRRLLRSEAVDVPVRVGLTGVRIEDGSTFSLPWGTLRPATSGELAALEGHLTVHPQSVVFEASLQATGYLGGSDSVERRWRRDYTAAASEISRRVDLTRLALLLGLQRDPLVGTARSWTLSAHPAGRFPSIGWTLEVHFEHGHVLSADDRDALMRWAALIDARYERKLDVATHRVLTALTIRGDPTDGLIDAVIALENLFGAGHGELVFRISTACAYLLAPRDRERRIELQREIKALYNERSRIVHGGTPPRASPAHEQRLRVAHLVVLSLRELFERRPALISDANRGERLILDGEAASVGS